MKIRPRLHGQYFSRIGVRLNPNLASFPNRTNDFCFYEFISHAAVCKGHYMALSHISVEGPLCWSLHIDKLMESFYADRNTRSNLCCVWSFGSADDCFQIDVSLITTVWQTQQHDFMHINNSTERSDVTGWCVPTPISIYTEFFVCLLPFKSNIDFSIGSLN